MKTIITSKGNSLDAGFDLRYGRTQFFCVYDEVTKSVEFLKNEFAEAQGGAGTKVAEKTIDLGVEKVISGDFGPKAKEVLEKFKVQMVIIEDEGYSIQDIIDRLN